MKYSGRKFSTKLRSPSGGKKLRYSILFREALVHLVGGPGIWKDVDNMKPFGEDEELNYVCSQRACPTVRSQNEVDSELHGFVGCRKKVWKIVSDLGKDLDCQRDHFKEHISIVSRIT